MPSHQSATYCLSLLSLIVQARRWPDSSKTPVFKPHVIQARPLSTSYMEAEYMPGTCLTQLQYTDDSTSDNAYYSTGLVQAV